MSMRSKMYTSLTKHFEHLQHVGRAATYETLLKRVVQQMPFLCFVRYIYPRNNLPLQEQTKKKGRRERVSFVEITRLVW